MARSRRFGRSRFTLVLLVLASLTILTLDYRDTGPIQGARGVAGTVVSPFRTAGEFIATPFRNGWNGIFGYSDLEEENRELRRELDRIRGERIEAAATQEEYNELLRINDLPVADEIDRVTAEVVSEPLTSFDSTIEINRGAGDGIKEGMSVVTDAGLVGRVLRVQGGRARVVLITDPAFGDVAVRLVDSGEVALAQSSGTDGKLEAREGVRSGTVVERGESVVTSGSDRSPYPGGIPVGTVESVARTGDAVEKTLVIEPIANLDGRYVVVLLCDEACT